MHPTQRVPGHESQHQGLRRNPAGQSSEPGNLPQRFRSLLKFKMTQIFQDDGGHRHAQRRGKILDPHSPLLFLIGQKVNQAIRQILCVPRLIELDREFFAIGHLAKICQIRAHNRHPISARQMRHSAATCRRRVGHHSNRRTLEKIW